MTVEETKVDISAALNSMLAKQLRVEAELKEMLSDGIRIQQLNELYAGAFDENFEFACEIVERSANYHDEAIEKLANEYKLAVHRCQKLVE
jgi:rRNA-processing protein FCF1